MKLNNQTWDSFAKAVAAPADPFEISPGATERLMKYLLPYVVDIKNVRPQFHAQNSIQLIDFKTDKEREQYNKAWEKYLEEIQKLDKIESKQRGFMILVEFLKFRQAAELIRYEHIADAMYESVTKYNQAAVNAANFKQSIAKSVYILNTKYGVPRSQISIIWGGSSIYTVKESEKMTQDEIKAIITRMMNGEDIEKAVLKKMINQIKAEESGLDNDTMAGLDLGVQSKEARQAEIDRFQSGKSLYCFYTFKSGGVGLSLHHTDERTKQKVRKKPGSGYSVEEDIPLIPTRQRITFLSPTYSAIELVQGLGRAPRLTSLSNTPQVILFYRGTIEERVAHIVSMKLKCLKKVVRQRETWEDCILSAHRDDKPYTEGEVLMLNDSVINTEDDSDGADSPCDLFIEDIEDTYKIGETIEAETIIKQITEQYKDYKIT